MLPEDDEDILIKSLDAFYKSLEERGLLGGVAKTSPDQWRGIPPEMFRGTPDDNGLVKWRFIPSPVTDEDVDALIVQLGLPGIPRLLRSYVKFRCTFDTSELLLPPVVSDAPLAALSQAVDAFSPLVRAQFLPFYIASEWGPVCVDQIDSLNGPIVAFKSDDLFSIGESECANRSSVAGIAFRIFDSIEALVASFLLESERTRTAFLR